MVAAVVHSKPGCPNCVRAEALLAAMDLPYTVIKYCPEQPGYAERRDTMFAAHGHRSFPNVYVGGEFVGGYAELVAAAADGRLGDADF